MGTEQTEANRLSDDYVLLHGFGLPAPDADFTKAATTGYPLSVSTPATDEDDKTTFTSTVTGLPSSTMPCYWRIVDALPCLDNLQTDTTTQYVSPTDPTPADFQVADIPGCANPAFLPDKHVEVTLNANLLNVASAADLVAKHPTIPIVVLTTNPTTGAVTQTTVDLPYDRPSAPTVYYRMTWDALLPLLPAGETVSGFIQDSRAR